MQNSEAGTRQAAARRLWLSKTVLLGFLRANKHGESFEDLLANVARWKDAHWQQLRTTIGHDCDAAARQTVQRTCEHALRLVRSGMMAQQAIAQAMSKAVSHETRASAAAKSDGVKVKGHVCVPAMMQAQKQPQKQQPQKQQPQKQQPQRAAGLCGRASGRARRRRRHRRARA